MRRISKIQVEYVFVRIAMIGLDVAFVWIMAWLWNPPINSNFVWFIALVVAYAMEFPVKR